MADNTESGQPDAGSTISRRRALRAGSIGVAAAVIGGVGFQLTDRAAASAHVTFSAENVDITTADGSIDEVTVEPEGTVTWSNLSEAPASALFELDVANNDDFSDDGDQRAGTGVEEQPIDDAEISDGETFELDLYDLLDDGSYEGESFLGSGSAPFSAADFEENTEDETSKTPVYLRLTVGLCESDEILDLSDPDLLIEETIETEFYVEVTNAAGELTFEIDANTSVESDKAIEDE